MPTHPRHFDDRPTDLYDADPWGEVVTDHDRNLWADAQSDEDDGITLGACTGCARIAVLLHGKCLTCSLNSPLTHR